MSPRNALKALTTILAATCLSGCFQVLVNGPVGGATVQIETLTRNGIPSQVLQVTTTRDEAALIEEFGQERWDEMSQRLKLLYLGTAEFDYDALDDDTYYLIAASGGVDYDYDHDWVIDEEPTPINGTWTMVATGAVATNNMAELGEQKVFVHCAANMRVSAFIYRYRTQVLGMDDETARVDLEKLWDPMGPWKDFIRRTAP